MPPSAVSHEGPEAGFPPIRPSPAEAASQPHHRHKRKGRPSRPEVLRAAATSGILLLTTLLLTKGKAV